MNGIVKYNNLLNTRQRTQSAESRTRQGVTRRRALRGHV